MNRWIREFSRLHLCQSERIKLAWNLNYSFRFPLRKPLRFLHMMTNVIMTTLHLKTSDIERLSKLLIDFLTYTKRMSIMYCIIRLIETYELTECDLFEKGTMD